MKQYNLHAMCLVASAFARSRRAEPVLFEKIGNAVCGKAASLYPRALASILFAFSEADVRHGVLFYNAPKHVAANISAYSVDELALVARAYGRFQMVHLPLFDAITATLPGRTLAAPAEGAATGEEEEDAVASYYYHYYYYY